MGVAVQYALADTDGSQVFSALTVPQGLSYKCLQCEGALELHRNENTPAHFTHKAKRGKKTCGGEEVPRRAAVLLLFGQLLQEVTEEGSFRWLLPCEGMEGVCPEETLIPQVLPLAHADDKRLEVEYGEHHFDMAALKWGRLLLGIRLVDEEAELLEVTPELPWLEFLVEDILTFRPRVPSNHLVAVRCRNCEERVVRQTRTEEADGTKRLPSPWERVQEMVAESVRARRVDRQG